ncbi:MAG: aldehyde ferredoxin oxidoreductase family protein [Candidatus Hodarchaeales archaeon]
MHGYIGKIIRVVLPRGKILIEEITEETLHNYLGGVGLATKLVFDETAPNADPLGPENTLAFAVGPFASTAVPTSGKFAVAAKSPLTGVIGYGIASGLFGPALKSAGYDAIIIQGRARGPLYLFIDDDEIRLRPAAKLAEMDAIEVEETIREEYGDSSIQVAAIGPAGEKMVRFACITLESTRQVGRCGLGAVMGSKNIKAVAVRGTKPVSLANPQAALQKYRELYKKCQSDATSKYRNLGTPQNVLVFNERGVLPTRNFQQGTFEHAEQISGERLKTELRKGTNACGGCAIGCDHIVQVKKGPYAGTKTGLDYESLFALGPCCGIDDISAIIKAADLCDRLGIDTISAGVVIAFAMEASEKGLIDEFLDEDLQDLRFGDWEAVVKLVERIGLREGIGDLLAEGTKRAAAKIGKGTDQFAMHVKGLELPGYILRGLKSAAVGFSVSTRGGCHLRNAAYSLDMKGPELNDKERGLKIVENENLYSVIDSLILCKFIRNAVSDEDIIELLRIVNGIELSHEELYRIGERITTLQKVFNIREGGTRKDDYPPPRVLQEPLPNGPNKGQFIPLEVYDLMLDAYYEARGWNSQGIPSQEKLRDLDLEGVLE